MRLRSIKMLLGWLSISTSLVTAKLIVANTPSVSDTTELAPCDSYCKHRFLYQSAFSATNLGIYQTMKAYGSIDWCTSVEAGWCPQVINHTMSAIAGKAVTGLSIDYKNCDDLCMVSSLSVAVGKSTLNAILWAERTVNGTTQLPDGSYTVTERNQTRILNLHKLVNSTSRRTTTGVDEAKLHAVMLSNKTDIASTSHQHNHQHHDRDRDLAIGLPFLALPIGVAPFIFQGSCVDPVLCNLKNLPYLKRLINGAEETLPEVDIVRPLQQDVDIGEVDVPETRGLGGDANMPYSPDVAEPEGMAPKLSRGQKFTVEKFNPETQTLEQQTLKWAGRRFEKQKQYGGVKPPRLLSDGYRPFYNLDAKGKVIENVEDDNIGGNVRPPGDRVSWHKVRDLQANDGGWRDLGERVVRFADDLPSLSSQGEPLVANPAAEGGAPLMLTPEVVPGLGHDDEYAFRLRDANGDLDRAADDSDSMLTMNPWEDGDSIRSTSSQELSDEDSDDESDGSHDSPPASDAPRLSSASAPQPSPTTALSATATLQTTTREHTAGPSLKHHSSSQTSTSSDTSMRQTSTHSAKTGATLPTATKGHPSTTKSVTKIKPTKIPGKVEDYLPFECTDIYTIQHHFKNPKKCVKIKACLQDAMDNGRIDNPHLVGKCTVPTSKPTPTPTPGCICVDPDGCEMPKKCMNVVKPDNSCEIHCF